MVQEEFQNPEPDPRPNAPKGRRIIRTYYVMSVIETAIRGKPLMRRRYWFDRTRNLLLVREQIFGDNGDLLADVSFDDIIRPAQFDGLIPTKIRINRPHDEYSVTLNLDAPTLSLNVEVPPQAFTLEKPADWGDTVETIDLDKISDQ